MARKGGNHLRGKDRRMLVHRQSGHAILHSVHTQQAPLHPDIPHLDGAVASTRDELSLTATLEVDIGDRRGVLMPLLDNMTTRADTLIIDADGAVVEARGNVVAFHLICC